MLLTDVTSFMDSFVSLMLSGVNTCFTLLDSISFHGVSVLDFSLALILIGVGTTILLAINKSAGSFTRSSLSGNRPNDRKE